MEKCSRCASVRLAKEEDPFIGAEPGGNVEAVLIRPATSADVPGLAATHVSSWQAGYRGLLPEAYLASLRPEDRYVRWESILTEPGSTTFLAEYEGVVAGFSVLGEPRPREASQTEAELHMLYVHPRYWNHGIGGQLERNAAAWLADSGYRTAFLWVLDTNDRARRFYVHVGWRYDGAEKTSVRADVMCTEVRYRKELRPGTVAAQDHDPRAKT
jgi:GNAT superfamily N-acetyltransferase